MSRLALYALAYGFYRAGGGTQSFAGSFEALWTHWDVRHYLGIAKDGYTSVGDERLRLVFFPLYPAVTRVFSVFTGGRLFMAGTLVFAAGFRRLRRAALRFGEYAPWAAPGRGWRSRISCSTR